MTKKNKSVKNSLIAQKEYRAIEISLKDGPANQIEAKKSIYQLNFCVK